MIIRHTRAPTLRLNLNFVDRGRSLVFHFVKKKKKKGESILIDEVKVLLLNEMQRFSFFFFTSFCYRLSSSSFPLLLSFLSIVKDIRKRNSFGFYFPFARCSFFYISYISDEIFFPLESIVLLTRNMTDAKIFSSRLFDSIQEKKCLPSLDESKKVKRLLSIILSQL